MRRRFRGNARMCRRAPVWVCIRREGCFEGIKKQAFPLRSRQLLARTFKAFYAPWEKRTTCFLHSMIALDIKKSNSRRLDPIDTRNFATISWESYDFSSQDFFRTFPNPGLIFIPIHPEPILQSALPRRFRRSASNILHNFFESTPYSAEIPASQSSSYPFFLCTILAIP